MKLISMTDFNLEKFDKLYDSKISQNELCHSIITYTKFLKQPLMLGMFVPCDDNGNVLSETYSEKENTKNKTFSQLSNEYQIAKSKVLFKNFIVKDTTKDNYLISNENVTFWIYSKETKTIDELTSYDCDLAISF